MKLPVHHIAFSEANGPGKRMVVWVQGCPHRCKNCFNPETHTFNSDNLMDAEEIADMINLQENIDGITFSGGEPLAYPLVISEIIQSINPYLSSIIFSGYSLDEVKADHLKMTPICLSDLTILGRYDDTLPHPYLGKKFVRTTNRIDMDYFKRLYNIEYNIHFDQITKTGIFKTKKYGL